MLWLLNFSKGGVGTNFFDHSKFEVKFFSEFFNLQSAVDAEFFARGSGHQLFFSHTKFEVTNFSEIFL